MGSEARYYRRQGWWKTDHPFLPLVRHHWWWLLHNCVSHPILGLWPSRWTVWFHDWTAMYLNCRDALRDSPMPQIPAGGYLRWAWHNIAGHIAIGLLPIRASFEFHDRTSEAMQVPKWL